MGNDEKSETQIKDKQLFKIDTESPSDDEPPPLLQQLTPVPASYQKRDSNIIGAFNEIGVFNETEETDVFPEMNGQKQLNLSNETIENKENTEYASDISDGKEEK